MTGQSTLDESAQDTNTFYRRTLHVLSDASVPFLVGGSHAFLEYTGIVRNTKDFDLFLRRSDLDRAMDALQASAPRYNLPDNLVGDATRVRLLRNHSVSLP